MGKRSAWVVLCCLITLGASGPTASEIHQAAAEGSLEKVDSLLKLDPDLLQTTDESAYTPLHRAAYNNHPEIVRLLLDRGAEVNAVSGSGSTPLHGAAYGGYTETAELLLTAGAEIDPANRYGFTPLLSACAAGRFEAARLLLDKGADLSARAQGGWTTLLYAAQSGDSSLVRLLLDKGAAVTLANENGETPLYQALWGNSLPNVRMLLEAGADVNTTTSDGTSLAYFAIAFRDPAMANLMLDDVDDVNQKDNLQFTMLHFASARGYADQVRTLLEKGADVNARCVNSRTPLDYALMWGQAAVIEVLRAEGGLAAADTVPWFTGDYLGQEKPGRSPIVFAENALLSPYSPHGSIAFSPDGTELFWCHRALPKQVVWYMRQRDGVWQRPMIAPFTDKDHEYSEAHPSFSPDGQRVFFHSKRPLTPGDEAKDEDIWYVDRVGDTWGAPINLGPPVNTEKDEFDPVVAANGDLYFIAHEYDNTLGFGDIYVSEYVDGAYTTPQNLGAAVNSDTHDMAPALAPDGGYMIFPSTREVMRSRDVKLFASFRKADGFWTSAVGLGREINQRGHSWHPTVSPDGKYLFYLRENNYWWISTELIQDMRDAVIGFEMPPGNGLTLPSFQKSDQYFEHAATNQIALADFDGDNDLDAVFSNMGLIDSRIYLNDGQGKFTITDQLLTKQGHGVGTGDLDGDGDVDIFMTCAGYGEGGMEYSRNSKVYLNDGHARFTDTRQDLQDSLLSGNTVHLGDVDNDGDLDAMVKYYQEPNRIYLNDGAANFAVTELTFPDNATWGDADLDGDLDALAVFTGEGIGCLLNDGAGMLTEVWRQTDTTALRGRGALLDLNGDGFPDAVVTQGEGFGSSATTVWHGDGTGRFSAAESGLPVTRWGRFSIGDLNLDGLEDLFVTNFGLPSAIWLNDPESGLVDCGLRLRGENVNSGCALGDVDGDGDLDAFVSAFGGGPNELWFNTTGE